MPSYVVYIDQVFIGSLVMNMMILWVTARLGNTAYSRWRLLAGAAVGALYSLFLFIPAMEGYLGPGYKLLVSFLMVAVVFVPGPPKKVLVLLAYFYISTFALGGTVLGIISFLQKTAFDVRLVGVMQAVDAFLWYGILLALLMYWFLGRVVPAVLRKRLMLPLLRADLTIRLGERKVCLQALLDTGNSLSDPLTGHPVIIAEYAAIKEILPDQVCAAVESHGRDDGASVLVALGENIRAGNFRIIPYRSVGRENGWLLGFRPDEVELKRGSNHIKVGNVVVALYRDCLQGDTSCRALLPAGLL
ncbi:sigma-E processing peptidase SpoIIGA [Desulfoscipio sp. XC116]|uniref:sigma-E processing peptidase SpoIIGA n=1 Tax=Desulfoscipio sp. XC116 TaxID=3144975 RepID=UPI00325BF13A